MGVRLSYYLYWRMRIEVSGGRLKADEVEKIIKLGKELLQLPGKPMDGVEETLKVLRERGEYH